MAFDIIYQRNEEIETADMGNEIGMLDIETGKYYLLNEIGSFIWLALSSPKSLQELVNELMENFDIDETTCKSETLSFIENLITKDIIRCI